MSASTRAAARLQIYTDGGAEPNPGVGGWGAVILDPTTGESRELSGGERHTTNNRMELQAAIEALRVVGGGGRVELFTDSSYLRLGVTEWLRRWKATGWRVRGGDPVKNEDLWRELAAVVSLHQVRWHWVKGHSGHPQNERAHALAAVEIARRRSGSRRAADGTGPAPADELARGAAAAGEPAGVEVLLKLSTSGARGAWAARVRRGRDERVLGGEASGVTSNRLELMAAAAVLEAVAPGEIVDWRGGSDYLREGASKWLEGWRRRGYRTSAGEALKNADLWRSLERPLAARTIRFHPAGEEDAPALAELEREAKRRLGGAR